MDNNRPTRTHIYDTLSFILEGISKVLTAEPERKNNVALNNPVSYIWVLVGRLLSIMIGIIFWLMDPTSSYQIISALILAWSLSVSWTQLVAYGDNDQAKISALMIW